MLLWLSYHLPATKGYAFRIIIFSLSSMFFASSTVSNIHAILEPKVSHVGRWIEESWWIKLLPLLKPMKPQFRMFEILQRKCSKAILSRINRSTNLMYLSKLRCTAKLPWKEHSKSLNGLEKEEKSKPICNAFKLI